MSQQFINEITLDYLLNKERFDKYIKHSNNKKKYEKDKKFYRKRIINLTKELILDASCNIYPEVKYTFESYINSCIHFFKSLDNNDIIQKDLATISDYNNNPSLDVSNNYTHANDEFIKTLKVENLLDKFVIKTSLGEKDIILPQKKNINLKDPILKTKGVKKISKKKNITNNYESTNQIQKKKNEKNKTNEKNNQDEKDQKKESIHEI